MTLRNLLTNPSYDIKSISSKNIEEQLRLSENLNQHNKRIHILNFFKNKNRLLLTNIAFKNLNIILERMIKLPKLNYDRIQKCYIHDCLYLLTLINKLDDTTFNILNLQLSSSRHLNKCSVMYKILSFYNQSTLLKDSPQDETYSSLSSEDDEIEIEI